MYLSLSLFLSLSLLKWVAMPSSRGSSRPRVQTHVSYIYLYSQMGSLQALCIPICHN